MSDELSDELVDAGSTANVGVPQVVKTLSILSIIGNSVMILFLVIAMLWMMSLGGAAGGLMAGAFAQAMGMVIVILLVMVAMNVVGMIAAIKLGKGQKGAFILYAIVTGIWALLFLYSGLSGGDIYGTLIGLSSAGFIVAFGMQMKNMPG